MLIANKVAMALEERRDSFKLAVQRSSEALMLYAESLEHLGRLSRAEIDERLGGVPWPGARPTSDLEQGLVQPFDHCWDSAIEARAWALDRLRGVTTVGVDGSQIAPSKEFGVPVSLVQVAWFENPHDGDRPYQKRVRNEVLAPGDPPQEIEEYAFAESRLNRTRFTLEMEAAAQSIDALPSDPPAVVFLDGTLILSFTRSMPPETRNDYLQALFGVLDVAEQRRVPVIGYTDGSFAGDLTGLLQHAFDLPARGVVDAPLLRSRLGILGRTAAFRCARGDVLPFYRREGQDYSRDLGFVYLQPGQDRPPARLDFPLWVVEARLLDHVVDIVRAEIVVGSGYPYPLETADAAAVLTTEDRLAFYRLWHQFAQDAGLTDGIPGKTVSKAHRR